MFYIHRNIKAADSEVICPRELRSWNAAQPVVFLIPNINQNFQRGAVKQSLYSGETIFKWETQSLVKTKSAFHRNRGEPAFYNVLAQVPNWSSFIQMTFPN